MIEYIAPTESLAYKACGVIALLNARRFYGHSTINPSGNLWDALLNLAECKAEAATEAKLDELCYTWNMRREGLAHNSLTCVKEYLERKIPVVLLVKAPLPPYHAALAIAVEGDKLEVVNYYGHKRPRDPVDWISWEDITEAEGHRWYALRQVM